MLQRVEPPRHFVLHKDLAPGGNELHGSLSLSLDARSRRLILRKSYGALEGVSAFVLQLRSEGRARHELGIIEGPPPK
jgi:hypothetical protein